MPEIKKAKTVKFRELPRAAKRPTVEAFKLPTARRAPSDDWLQYAYLLTGQKKIGKTTFAVQGAEELVLQFDKPQIGINVREVVVESWDKFLRVLKALEEAARVEDFPYDRIIVDGAGEWYSQCQTWVCKELGISHPSDEDYGKGWHRLRDEFTNAVNRVMRLQTTARCGLMFIAHSEWKEVQLRDKTKVEKLVPNLPPRCEEILNGKVDGWFTYDYSGDDRVLVVIGDETTGAGHRIDGRFLTPDGRRVVEVPMGGSPQEALANFTSAFQNKQLHATMAEARKAAATSRVGPGGPAKIGGGRVAAPALKKIAKTAKNPR